MDIENIKGIGKQTVKLFNSKNIFTIDDLINYFPISYNEFNSEQLSDGKVQVKGIIQSKLSNFSSRNGVNVISFYVILGNEERVKVVAFNQKFLAFNYKENDKVVINGTYDSSRNSIVLQQISKEEGSDQSNFIAVYSHIKGLTSFKINKYIKEALTHVTHIKLYKDYIEVHNPTNIDNLSNSLYNLKYEEFHNYILKIKQLNINAKLSNDDYIKNVKFQNSFNELLPFDLTDDQTSAILKIESNFNLNILSSQLVLGDVGSGKTIVAIAASKMISDIGMQTAIMAPTSIVATQIYNQISYLLPEANCELLTGSVTTFQKNKVKDRLLINKCKIVVGTHALLSDDVVFDNLGLVIIDEQHKFGVNQRQKLLTKGDNVEYISLSATPIPRTLALSLFNVNDLIEIKSKPTNRKKVETYLFDRSKRDEMLNNMEKHLENKNQVYIVAPNIDQSEVKNVTNVIDVYNALKKKYSNYSVGLLHGYLKNKDKIIEQFKNKEFDILICTTVIEVGVDVSDATCIVILNAERFGIATLHQLRGRVGRSNKESECYLYNMSKNKDSLERLNLLLKYDDGFKLATYDMKYRGNGDFFGVSQSGNPDFKIFNYQTDQDIANDVINSIN